MKKKIIKERNFKTSLLAEVYSRPGSLQSSTSCDVYEDEIWLKVFARILKKRKPFIYPEGTKYSWMAISNLGFYGENR